MGLPVTFRVLQPNNRVTSFVKSQERPMTPAFNAAAPRQPETAQPRTAKPQPCLQDICPCYRPRIAVPR